MNLIINGKSTKLDQPISLKELAIQYDLNVDTIVIEYNGDIPDKSNFDAIMTQDNDQIEFIHFVGGG